jgi:hypothetical protein
MSVTKFPPRAAARKADPHDLVPAFFGPLEQTPIELWALAGLHSDDLIRRLSTPSPDSPSPLLRAAAETAK